LGSARETIDQDKGKGAVACIRADNDKLPPKLVNATDIKKQISILTTTKLIDPEAI
jgi:hypothetical protein